MATTAPPTNALTEYPRPAASGPRANPFVLWHLLSLDAPTVAALWAWFVARESYIRLPFSSILAMAIAVWMLYAADRLLDSRSSPSGRSLHELEERHYFHRNHRLAFICGIVFASAVLAALLPRLGAPALRLYTILGAMLSAYFALIHIPANRHGQRLPKELAVGVFFSAAIFIPTISRQPGLRLALLPAAILFAILCSLNCVFIYAWEHPTVPLVPQRPLVQLTTHPATRIALRFLPLIACATILCGLFVALVDPLLHWQVPAACAASAALLLLLHRSRRRLAPLTLRTAADLCLLTPILFLSR